VQVVSVINHKGGVGKTTLTANLGAGLAARGKRVLMIDLDSQASLTLSFFSFDEWVYRLAPTKTIKHWFDALGAGTEADLASLVAKPSRVNDRLPFDGEGCVELISAHRDLGQVDIALGSHVLNHPAHHAFVYDQLRSALRTSELAEYDVVLIDCSPAFGPISKSAVAAADLILIPTRPDYLSTNGIQSLDALIDDFVTEFNSVRGDIDEIRRAPASIVFTMVQSEDGEPIEDQLHYMEQIPTEAIPAFDTTIGDSKGVYGPAPVNGVPVILAGTGRSQTRELRNVVSELMERLEEVEPASV
jgi:chromosome partitioning protein